MACRRGRGVTWPGAGVACTAAPVGVRAVVLRRQGLHLWTRGHGPGHGQRSPRLTLPLGPAACQALEDDCPSEAEWTAQPLRPAPGGQQLGDPESEEDEDKGDDDPPAAALAGSLPGESNGIAASLPRLRGLRSEGGADVPSGGPGTGERQRAAPAGDSKGGAGAPQLSEGVAGAHARRPARPSGSARSSDNGNSAPPAEPSTTLRAEPVAPSGSGVAELPAGGAIMPRPGLHRRTSSRLRAGNLPPVAESERELEERNSGASTQGTQPPCGSGSNLFASLSQWQASRSEAQLTASSLSRAAERVPAGGEGGEGGAVQVAMQAGRVGASCAGVAGQQGTQKAARRRPVPRRSASVAAVMVRAAGGAAGGEAQGGADAVAPSAVAAILEDPSGEGQEPGQPKAASPNGPDALLGLFGTTDSIGNVGGRPSDARAPLPGFTAPGSPRAPLFPSPLGAMSRFVDTPIALGEAGREEAAPFTEDLPGDEDEDSTEEVVAAEGPDSSAPLVVEATTLRPSSRPSSSTGGSKDGIAQHQPGHAADAPAAIASGGWGGWLGLRPSASSSERGHPSSTCRPPMCLVRRADL
jgi:hypothetical protein